MVENNPFGGDPFGGAPFGPKPGGGGAPAEDVTIDKWGQPPTQPRRALDLKSKQGAMVAALAGFIGTMMPLPGDANTVAAAHVTGPVFGKSIVYQSLAYAPYIAPPAEDVTVDKWHGPLSDPTRRVVVRQTAGGVHDPFVRTVDIGWFQHLDEPTRATVRRQQAGLIYFDYAVPPTETVTVDKWFRDLDMPVRRILRQTAGCIHDPFPRTFNYDWLQQLDTPTRRIVDRQEAGLVWSGHTPAPAVSGDGTGLISALASGPLFSKWVIYQSQAYAPYPVEVVAETVTVDKWFRPLNDPTRRIVSRQDDYAYAPTLIEDAAIQAKWFQPFGTPRAAKRVPEFPAYAYSPYFVPPESGVGVEFNWWPNLSERLRQKRPPLWIGETYTPYIQAQELITLDKWYVEFETPVRVRRVTSEEGSFFFVGDLTDRFQWRQPFSVPKLWRPRPEGIFTIDPLPRVSSPDRWWRPLDEPTRRRVFRQPAGQIEGNPFPRTVDIGWHRPLLEPTRRIVQRLQGQFVFYVLPLETDLTNVSTCYTIFVDELNRTIVAVPVEALEPFALTRTVQLTSIDTVEAFPILRTHTVKCSMARIPSWPSKDPNDSAVYRIDWTDRLAGDSISTSTWTLLQGSVALGSSSNTTTTATVLITGGTIGETATIVNRVTVSSGEQWEQTVKLPVRKR
jgi:hypothetical protein